ncbi:MAG: hypothetical protein LBG88_01650 [Christensenellaceae bacterium]|jgi:hypothetical protein|nr:hypothetical protein [Christensenellaceae bacterium]
MNELESLIDGENMLSAYDRGTSASILTAYEDVPTKPVFNLQHNLAEYNDYVESRYQNSVVALDAYEEPVTSPTINVNFGLEQYVAPTPSYSTNSTTFAPNILDYEKPGFQPKHRELIAEIEVEDIDIAPQVENKVEKDADIQSDVGFTTHLKLNAVGMIAVVSFIAVTLMVIAFVIANSITIGKTGARIDALQSNNTEIAGKLLAKQTETTALYSDVTANISEEYLIGLGYAPVEVVEIPEAKWIPQGNVDKSTNFFDAIARFFNKLFA